MAVIGPISTTSATNIVDNDFDGIIDWVDLVEMQGQDDVFAYIASNSTFKDSFISLYYLGSAIGDNKATNSEINVDPFPATYPPTYWSYDGNSAYWGVTLTPTILNHASFGVAFDWTRIFDDLVADRILLSGFSPSVPGDATDISLKAEFRIGPNNGGDLYPGIDNVRVAITYTAGGGGTVGRIVTINQAVRRASTF
jgi:hypothetical protein